MVISIIQSLMSLLLAGLIIYTLLTSDKMGQNIQRIQIFIGVCFGAMILSFALTNFGEDQLKIPSAAKAGLLVFGGYLGGPIGAAIVALFAASYPIVDGGEHIPLRIFMNVTPVLLGFLISLKYTSKQWPKIPRNALWMALGFFCALFTVPLVYVSTYDLTPDAQQRAYLNVARFAIVGVISITFTYFLINKAEFHAAIARRARRLNMRLKATLGASNMGIFEFAYGKGDVYFDDGAIALLGMDQPADIASLAKWRKVVHPDDLEDVISSFVKKIKSGETKHWDEYRIIRPDGEVRHIRSQWGIHREEQDTVPHIIGVISDVTKIRAQQREYMSTIERTAILTRNLPGVVCQWNCTDIENPKLLFISPNCINIGGYTDSDFYENPSLIMNTVSPQHRAGFLMAVRNGTQTDKEGHFRFEVTTRDGRKRWLEYRGSSHNVGKQIIADAIILDVTREVDLSAQVDKEREISFRAQKSESIGQLTGGIAHDFNNLMAVILASLELLEGKNSASEKKQLLLEAKNATLLGADLTKSLLAFARQARLSPVALNLGAVVSESRNWLERSLPESIEVDVSCAADLWPILVDRSSLESALLNLILNARDAMHGQGVLNISVQNITTKIPTFDLRDEKLPAGDYVVLSVADTGEGMTMAVVDRLFEPYFTTKEMGKGSGLGLAMIIGFIKQSGGTIHVETQVDNGAVFKLYFPRHTGSLEETPPINCVNETSSNTGQRILMAEDNDAVRAMLQTVLDRAGYRVVAVASGDLALEMFQSDPNFDILLTDIVMPGQLQGAQLAKRIRVIAPELPIVLMSGYSNETDEEGDAFGVNAVRLMKPVKRADLLAALANVAGRKKCTEFDHAEPFDTP